MRLTWSLPWRIFPLKMKIYMYHFVIPDTVFNFHNMPSEIPGLHETLLLGDRTLNFLCRICTLKIKIYIHPFVMRLTLTLLCKMQTLKIKIYMYPFLVRPRLPLPCRIWALKIKIYMDTSVMTPTLLLLYRTCPLKSNYMKSILQNMAVIYREIWE